MARVKNKWDQVSPTEKTNWKCNKNINSDCFF